MHSKDAVIDGTRALVGYCNPDPCSERLNSETAVVFLQPELSQRLRQSFLTNVCASAGRSRSSRRVSSNSRPA
jgi:phosphatidylserine/phosphatidylglycerophosphate/cardiolipin synthase-like enzyme